MYDDPDDREAEFYGEDEDEEMPTTERDLADDAQWKLIQKNTFSRWANEHLKTVGKSITDLENDLSDGLRLLYLIEVLAGKKFKHINKRPNFRTQKLENVTMALQYLEGDEGIRIVNIDSGDIVDKKLKLILGLIWTLILHYSISMPMWEGEEPGPSEGGPTPKQRLLNWVQSKCPDIPIKNFSTDWNDGKAIGALVDAVGPGLCPDWEDWDPKKAKQNAKEALDAAEKWLGVPQLIKPDEITNPKVDEMSMMTYLSQFPNAKLKAGAPLRPRLNPNRVRAYGPGLEPKGNQVGAPARFTVETFSAGQGKLEITVLNPKGKPEKCEEVFNNDRNLTYSCVYVPSMEGEFRVIIKFSSKEVPKSPFIVKVEGSAGDFTKVRAVGPGIEKVGVIATKRTHFEVFTKDAGIGKVDVAILDPHGRKDTVRPSINRRPDKEGVYLVEYVPREPGLHSVNIFFAGHQIPNSPYGVGVAPVGGGPIPPGKPPVQETMTQAPPGAAPLGTAPPKGKAPPGKDKKAPPAKKPVSNAKLCFATGRGIQPKGIRVRENADFRVHTKGAGEAELKIQILGPEGAAKPVGKVQSGFGQSYAQKSKAAPGKGGVEIKCTIKKSTTEEGCFECIYVPATPGQYIINISFGDAPIQKSPFKVEVGPPMESKIVAYGPGLEGGVVNQPAVFTVETNGETGALDFKSKIRFSIEGPSQAKIDCKDNGDGSADITYWPTVPGEYAVHILCNEEDIPKSPYMAQITPATGEFDASKVTAKGPGLEKTGVTIQKWAEFVVDTKKGGKAPLKITCMDIDYKLLEVQIKDNKDGTYSCRYMPRAPVKHTITITYGGVQIPNSPYRVLVQEPSKPANVRVFGPGVEKGVKTSVLTFFTVDCKTAGPGDVAIALTDDRGKDVPVNTIDNGDGTFRVEYKPETPGMYTVAVYFADKEIPKSPIKVKVESSIDLSKVKVLGLETPVKIGEERDIDIITTGAGKSDTPARVMITSPTGKKGEIPTQETIDGYGAKFALLEPGPHKFDISYAGKPVPKSPFTVQALPKPKVKAYGPGLKGGKANQPAHFTIDTREETTPGNLGVTVEGPSEAKIESRDNQNGTCDVTYFPTVPGDYAVNITYGDQHIPNSPYHATIEPGPTIDLSNVTAYGPGLEPTGVYMSAPNEFTVDAKSVSPVGKGNVRAIVTSPSGQKTDSLVKDNLDGTYNVLYTPYEQGPQSIDVTYEELEIPKSPFQVNAVPGCDASRVKAYGPGLEGGLTDDNQTFTVDVKGAGQGGLALAIDGPAETPINCKDNRDGTCQVDYMPTKPGDYAVTVKFADQQIPGSPFPVKIKAPVNPNKVKCYGPGLDTNQGVRAGQPATFTVDTTEAGEAPLDVSYTDAKGMKRPADLVPVAEGKFDATYYPVEEGPCTVEVKYANQQVPKSPFQQRVTPSADASKVRVGGPGVNPVVDASLPVTFTIDCTDAGVADLEVTIQRPDGSYVEPTIEDNGDGTFNVSYTPEELGPYTVSVKFGGKDVPNAPFKVMSRPSGDATKCRITDGPEKMVPLNKETVISVDATMAGTGKVTCRICSPNGTEIDIDIVERDGTFSIQFTPNFPGDYTICIKFGGQTIPEGDYTVTVGEDLIAPERRPDVQSAPPGAGLLQPVDFRIPIGPIFNFVSAEIVMPSGKRGYPKIQDNKDGTVNIQYQPTEIGLHELHVKYNNEEVDGSPFLFHVDALNSGYVTAYGPGLSHGVISEPAEFTIVTKDAGAGGLSLAIEGPSKTEIKCKDNQDGTCTVSYIPTSPGEYVISVKFADKHISGSPFTAKITPGQVIIRKRAQIGRSSEVSLKVTETDISSLTASIRSPSGHEEPCILKRLPNGHLGISFTPREVGEHLVNVFRNNNHIANSPFKIVVGESELGNASKVKVYGPGLEKGMAHEVNEFTVDTQDAGYGGLSLSIEGPSKADIECHDNEDGSCRVTYKPTEPGTYLINIKFADEHVPGSPFNVKIGGEPSSRITERITRHREAADITHIGSQCELSLKIPGTSPFDMTASVTSPNGVTELCDIVSLDDCHYSIKFVPNEMGVHTVSVKHKDMHIPGSPFEFTVGPITGGGAHKVHAAGPGLERGEVEQPCDFNIYTREAGAGGLSIAVEGPAKAEIDFEDRKDGSCGVTYIVTEPGEYMVSIKFSDEHIPDSPFRVYVTPSIGEARKVSVSSLQSKGLQVGKPAAFVVNFNGAKGKIFARVVAPSGAEDEALVQEIDEEEYAVRFIPRENGPHLVHVTFDGCPIPDSPFRIMVGKVDADPGMVQAFGDGLKFGQTGQVAKFQVSTVNAGAGALGVTVEGPSKVKLECREVDEGYEFTYTPTAPGDYLITIKYAGSHIACSPFRARIEGPGQPTGIQEQATVTVETVTKTSIMSRFSSIQKFQSDASKVTCEGSGLKKAYRGKQATFTVDTTYAGNNIMYVGMMGPKGPCEELIVKHTGGAVYKISYNVRERGDYMLIVRWGETDIPGSPFCVKCD